MFGRNELGALKIEMALRLGMDRQSKKGGGDKQHRGRMSRERAWLVAIKWKVGTVTPWGAVLHPLHLPTHLRKLVVEFPTKPADLQYWEIFGNCLQAAE